jgi:hypothetical protein
MPLGIDAVVASVAKIASQVIERVWPDPAQQAEAQRRLFELQQTGELAHLTAATDLAKLQAQTNIEEAKHQNVFISGWRPAVGWICASGLGYQVLARPLLGWVMENLFDWTMPPDLEMDTLMTLLFGMLGLGGYRTYEKVKGAEGNR